MKTRTSFVANSSSSSFIVGFDKKPKNVLELAKLMFPGSELSESAGYNEYSNPEGEILVINVVERVFNDLKKLKPLTEAQILEQINNGHFEGYPEYVWDDPQENKLMKAFEKKHGKRYYDVIGGKDKKYQKDIEEIDKYQRKKWDDEAKKVAEAATKLWEREKTLFRRKKIFVLSYGDENGNFEGFMEHNGIFDRIPCLYISHH